MASGAETCRFTGTTDYAGHVTATATAAKAGDVTHIDVVLRFDARTALWLPIRYLVEEISDWRGGTLQSLDMNTRYAFAGHVVRQQWDDFKTAKDGLEAQRIEGKTAAEFRRQYPRFAAHWDFSAFAQPWLADYAAAAPKRRPDLDLGRPADATSLQAPFALAFYWVRFLRPQPTSEQVFLPGFKADKLAAVTMTPLAGAHPQHWRADLHHSYLSREPPSFATAELDEQGHVQSLTFTLHGSAGSANGSLRETGCEGAAVP